MSDAVAVVVRFNDLWRAVVEGGPVREWQVAGDTPAARSALGIIFDTASVRCAAVVPCSGQRAAGMRQRSVVSLR
jgi:hypothetical protein